MVHGRCAVHEAVGRSADPAPAEGNCGRDFFRCRRGHSCGAAQYAPAKKGLSVVCTAGHPRGVGLHTQCEAYLLALLFAMVMYSTVLLSLIHTPPLVDEGVSGLRYYFYRLAIEIIETIVVLINTLSADLSVCVRYY